MPSSIETAGMNILGLGAAKDAARMERIVNFYSRLPKGPAPEPRPVGLLAKYQARYFGNKPSAMRESRKKKEKEKTVKT
ncbi:hypothetical protein KEM54_003507 [Ascosphaera aggregata]|nr:hypothetical protein KEM54_003507 [Ascosphaera aggregata]